MLVGQLWGQALPRQSHYMERGLQAGMAVGMVGRSDCQSRLHWQGTAEYSYNKFVSGGVDFKVFGGKVDEYSSLVSSRYFVFARGRAPVSSKLRFFLGPLLGFESTNIKEMRADILGADSVQLDDKSCSDAFGAHGLSLGGEVGGGYKINRWLDFTLMQTFEFNVFRNPRLSFVPGLALNMAEIFPQSRSNLQQLWLHLEWVHTYVLQYGGVNNLYQGGISLGF